MNRRVADSRASVQGALKWGTIFVPGARSGDLEKARIGRHLAAIFAADVAGYSRLMGRCSKFPAYFPGGVAAHCENGAAGI